MNKPLVRFGILSFDWRGFAVGIFDRMPEGTIKLVEYKLSNACSVEDFATFIEPYKTDGEYPLKVIFMSKSDSFGRIHQVLGQWIDLHQVKDLTNVSNLLVRLGMYLNDGKLLMHENDARHFQADIKKATLTDYSMSVNMLLMLVTRYADIQNIGVPQKRKQVY